MEISFKEPYYSFKEQGDIKSIKVYHKFLNWLQGEFDLCQMDESEGLKVYYPDGCFNIKLVNLDNNVNVEINVICKSKKRGMDTFNKIESVYHHIFNRLS